MCGWYKVSGLNCLVLNWLLRQMKRFSLRYVAQRGAVERFLESVDISLWFQPGYRAFWPVLITVASPLGSLAVRGVLLKQPLGSHQTSYEVQYTVLHSSALCTLGILLHASRAVQNPFHAKVEVFLSPHAITEQVVEKCEQVDQYFIFSRLISSWLLTDCGWLPSVWQITSQTKVNGTSWRILSLGSISEPGWSLLFKLERGWFTSVRYK